MITITIQQPVNLPKLEFKSVTELWEALTTWQQEQEERIVPLETELQWDREIVEETKAGRVYTNVDDAMHSLLNDPV